MTSTRAEISLPLALNTATLGHNIAGCGCGWSPERVIDACAERGFRGITFWRREIGARAVTIGERTRAAGLQVFGLCRLPFLVGSQAPANAQDDAKAAIDMAASLGAPVLTLVTGGTEPGTKGLQETQKILAARTAPLADLAAQQGICLALEPLNPMFGGNRTCLMTVRDALQVCEMTGASNVGIAVDVYHVWWDSTLAESCITAGDRIAGFHVCDWLENTQDMLLDRGMMGDGIADLPAIRRAVTDAGYRGPCEVEIFSARDWWTRDPNEVLDIVIERYGAVC